MTTRIPKAAFPLALLALTITAGAPAAQGGPTTKSAQSLSQQDRSFVTKAAAGGMAEVESAQVAQQNAHSQQVKDFAARMTQDHSQANDKLKQIASDKGVHLPAGLDKAGQSEVAKLRRVSGASFDRVYAKHEVTDHKKVIAAFEREVKSGKDGDVKNFAEETLPTLREHLQLAEEAVKSAGR